MVGQIGNIIEIASCRVDWEIRYFSSLSTESKFFYSSPTFKCCDESFNMRIYPNGSSEQSSGYVSIYLNKQNSGPSPLLVDFEISIKDKLRYQYATKRLKEVYKKNECIGWPKYCKRSELLEIKDLASPGSKLIISCVLFCEKLDGETSNPKGNNIESSTKLTLKSPESPMIQNKKDLFLSRINSDVLIRVNGKEFPAHKEILASRSPILKRLLMQNNPDIINIEGFSPDVVRHLLSFIYSDEVKDITIDNVFDLYAITSEYDIKYFKEECERFLMKNMTLEILCKVIIMSRKYDSLTKVATMYLERNASKVLITDVWKKFERENKADAENILKTIDLEKKSLQDKMY